MKVVASMVEGPVTAEIHAQACATGGFDGAPDETGARVRFEGVVRRGETDPQQDRVRALEALDYETYEPMAERALVELARTIGTRHALQGVVALHSRGRVRVGEVSFVLELHAAHRAPALAAMSEFIDALKRDVPIWKKPVWARD